MIWTTVSSQFCFCWLYRAFPSLATKNIINLISVLTIWWCPCVESSLVFLEEGVCYDQCILLAKLLAFACFILYSKAKLACYCRYLLILRIWLIFSVLSIFPNLVHWACLSFRIRHLFEKLKDSAAIISAYLTADIDSQCEPQGF